MSILAIVYNAGFKALLPSPVAAARISAAMICTAMQEPRRCPGESSIRQRRKAEGETAGHRRQAPHIRH